MVKLTRLFHAADLHGSEACFRKVVASVKLYKPDVITICGDLTGKGIIPIIERPDTTFTASFFGKEYAMRTQQEVGSLVEKIRLNGWYDWHCTPAQMDEFRASKELQTKIFSQVIPETMKRWVSMARDGLKGKNVRLFILPGNDDEFVVDEVLRDTGCDYITNPEGKIVQIDADHEMISTGYCNITPWHAYRDIPEEELAQKIEAMASQVKNMSSCIFNFHCPPFNTLLDAAPKLDKTLRPIMSGGATEMAPAGSVAVRNAIEKYQPFLGLHGHIHESRGVEKIGRTMCVNPGSEYGEGIVRGCLINMDKDSVKSYLFTSG